MQILIAVHGFPPTHTAGAERQAERMARWLLNNNHQVEVFAVEKVDDPSYRVVQSEEQGLIIHRLYYNVRDGGHEFLNLYDNAQVGSALQTLLSQRSFDLMHLVSGYLLGVQAIEAARAANLRVVVSPMEFWFMCAQLTLIQTTGKLCSGPESDYKCARCVLENKRRYQYFYQHFPATSNLFWKLARHTSFAQDTIEAIARRRTKLRQALDQADRVICNSHFLIDKFAEFGFNTSRYVYIRQGLATPFQQMPPRNTHTGDGIRIGYIGQIKYHKGLDLLISAVTQLLDEQQPFSLDIWGNESEAPAYTASLKRHSQEYPSIRWNGRYSGSEVWDVLSRLDVLVVPSRWYENSPNVILEAYKAGLPVITTALGGMAELVEHERSGLLFTLDDVSSLKQQLQRLVQEPELLNQLRAGIPPVKTIDEEMRETLEQYQALMAVQ